MGRTIYSKDHKRLINKLKKARVELGLDQIEVAEKLKKSQSYVSKIESGQRRLDIVQMNEFAKIYNKSIDYFIK
ncbi:MAG: helix-turn-helix transcriptional regulator [Candidatus Margulisbacteria bacterium]|nr:helix-turn-helix transcriptional regulator [Candidatus Margulisiibacteriota bacterium]